MLRFTFARFSSPNPATSFQTLGILMNTGKYRHNIRSQDIKGILFINFLCPDNKIFLPDFYIVIEHNGKLCRKMGAHPSYPKVISSCNPAFSSFRRTVTLSCPAYSSLRIRPVPLGDALSTITICLLPSSAWIRSTHVLVISTRGNAVLQMLSSFPLPPSFLHC